MYYGGKSAPMDLIMNDLFNIFPNIYKMFLQIIYNKTVVRYEIFYLQKLLCHYIIYTCKNISFFLFPCLIKLKILNQIYVLDFSLI